MSTSKTRISWAVALVVAAIVGVSVFGFGRETRLSAEEVAGKIKDHHEFQKGITATIQEGEFCAPSTDGVFDFQKWFSQRHPATNVAWKRGVLEIANARREYVDFSPTMPAACKRTQAEIVQHKGQNALDALRAMGTKYWIWNQTLTDQAKKAGLSPHVSVYLVSEKQLEQVTWVSDVQGNTITAEYQWKWVPTDIGRQLGMIADPQPTVARVTLIRLNDDSWGIYDVGSSQTVASNR